MANFIGDNICDTFRSILNVGGTATSNCEIPASGLIAVTDAAGNVSSLCIGRASNGAFISGNFTTSSTDNCITGNYSSIIGGTANSITSDKSAIVGGGSNTINGYQSFIGGGAGNTAKSTRNFIAGGDTNITDCSFSAIIGGYCNSACGERAVIIGGLCNQILNSPDTSIIGGCNNCICNSCNTSIIGTNNVTVDGLDDFAVMCNICAIGIICQQGTLAVERSTGSTSIFSISAADYDIFIGGACSTADPNTLYILTCSV